MEKNNALAPYEKQFDVVTRKQMVSEMLRELRTASGFQQKEVAEILGVSPQTYNGYEKGRNEPPIEILVRLSFLYGIPVDMIIQKDRMHAYGQSAKETVKAVEQQIAEMRNNLVNTKFGENDQIHALITMMEQLTEVSREIVEKAKL